jgi:hypothetical protein
MSNTTIAVWTIVWIFIILILYRFVFNPQILIIPSVINLKGCPEHWYKQGSLCVPNYTTSCRPFDPLKITTLSQACSICKACGTNWNGQC